MYECTKSHYVPYIALVIDGRHSTSLPSSSPAQASRPRSSPFPGPLRPVRLGRAARPKRRTISDLSSGPGRLDR